MLQYTPILRFSQIKKTLFFKQKLGIKERQRRVFKEGKIAK